MLPPWCRAALAAAVVVACSADPAAPRDDAAPDADGPPADAALDAHGLTADREEAAVAPTRDAVVDAREDAAMEAPALDAAPDRSMGLLDVAGVDATTDGGVDAARDATVDAVMDVAPDAAVDVAREPALDAAPDAVADAPADARPDAPADVAPPPPPPPPPPPSAVLSPAGAVWRYLDDGSDPGPAWTTPAFRDAAWRSGPARLGFGDGGEATVVRYGADPANKHVTTYFRRAFTVADPTAYRFVVLRLVRDDGAVVYVNGREARRDNLAEGAVTRATLATLTVGGVEEDTFQERLLDPSLLVAGANTLAVELHQSSRDSSDLSFDLELVGFRDSFVPEESDPVLLAVGDISTCRNDFDERTAQLVDVLPGPVATLGDTVYDSGNEAEFAMCFEPTWGRHRARIRPAVGNHEYYTPDAAPYYRYFGAAAGDPARGYYSYDVGAWHVVALNSNCAAVGGCSAGSPQDRWLVADLAASRARCTLAYWHHPLFTSGTHGPTEEVRPLYQRLYDADADLVLTGHEHDYERFAPMDAMGNVNAARGIREFVVGTGGVELRWFPGVAAHSEVRDVATHGVLRLVLRATGYAWRFVPVAGEAFTDSGVAACH